MNDLSAASPEPSKPPKRKWSRFRRFLIIGGIALLVLTSVAAFVGVGRMLYENEKGSQQRQTTVGYKETAVLELDVTAQRVDTDNRQLLLNVVPVPRGALAGSPARALAQDVEVVTTSPVLPIIHLSKGTIPTPLQVPILLEGGPASDYPFDHYLAFMIWLAKTPDGAPAETMMVFNETDPFFSVEPSFDFDTAVVVVFTGQAALGVKASRSHSVIVLAGFMALAMWTLALAVLGGAIVLLRQRQRIVWPAMGWMAATLFAIVGLRSAAPGSPAIGSLLDYTAFFWSEAIITLSVALVTVSGILADRRYERDIATGARAA
ncbi:DUF4436 family protein [Kitasatospora sp. NPDC127111]|uniref:DUF4436 family protein n=1 Tax=Kitasatospora sp. NPDC127111 TaxID=3345363 RepID=UPI003625F4F1